MIGWNIWLKTKKQKVPIGPLNWIIDDSAWSVILGDIKCYLLSYQVDLSWPPLRPKAEINVCTAQFNEKMKLVSVTLLTRPRTDVCVHYTQAWMLLCVTQLQKCLQCCPMCTVCVCLFLPPLSLCALLLTKLNGQCIKSLSLLIPAASFHLSPPLEHGHGSAALSIQMSSYSRRFSNSPPSVLS